MIIVFDLDDTLYAERTYVESGFRSVAEFAAARFGWDAEDGAMQMLDIMDREGRGAVFDGWLAAHGKRSRALIRECISVYRHHRPLIELYPQTLALLPRLAGHQLYVVTDGNKIVQSMKADTLGLNRFFKHVYITHRYGTKNAKPATHCFDLIRKRESADWRQIVYVGDNPAKDFVGLNPLGAHTVRVLTGNWQSVRARPGFEAQHVICNLGDLPGTLSKISPG